MYIYNYRLYNTKIKKGFGYILRYLIFIGYQIKKVRIYIKKTCSTFH